MQLAAKKWSQTLPVIAGIALVCACSVDDIPARGNIDDGSTTVVPVATIKVALDSSTPQGLVLDDAFRLVADPGFRLLGTVELDTDSMVVEFTPIRPMTAGTRYTFSSELLGPDGEPISLAFTTLSNRLVRQLDFVPGSNNLTGYFENDADGTSFQFADPGPDLVWLTDDDVLATYAITEERVDDTQLVITFDVGPDGMPSTADDFPTLYRRSVFEGLLRVRQDQFRVGADGAVGTSDDELFQLRVEQRNEFGQILKLAIGIDGGDNIPGSADDNILIAFAVVYDERGLSERFVGIDAGADGEFLTDDDVIPDGPPTTFYNDQGVFVGFEDGLRGTNYVDERGIYYREDQFEAGLDGVLGTPDDRIFFRLEYEVPP